MDSSLSRRLTTLCSDRPRDIREQVIEVLRASVANHAGMFIDCVERDGQYYFTSLSFHGDEDVHAAVARHEDRPAQTVPWLPSHLDPRVVNRFVSIRTFYDENELFSLPIQRDLFVPLDVCDQLRAVLFDGTRFLGWIGLLRRGNDEPFRPSEVEELSAVLAEVKTALAAARAYESAELDGGVCAVYRSCGEIEHASRSFAQWLTRERRDHLRRRVEQFDVGTNETAIEVLAGMEVRFVRLDGPNGVRYLASVGRAPVLEIGPENWLTSRQREVADYAIAGATTAEIASQLGLSKETVKSHIRNIYERLGVSNRLELSHLLAA